MSIEHPSLEARLSILHARVFSPDLLVNVDDTRDVHNSDDVLSERRPVMALDPERMAHLRAWATLRAIEDWRAIEALRGQR